MEMGLAGFHFRFVVETMGLGFHFHIAGLLTLVDGTHVFFNDELERMGSIDIMIAIQSSLHYR